MLIQFSFYRRGAASETTANTVLRLSERMNKGDVVIGDSLFGSITLLQKLADRGIHSILACRADRAGPLFSSQLLGQQVGQGESATLYGSVPCGEDGESVPFLANCIHTVGKNHKLVSTLATVTSGDEIDRERERMVDDDDQEDGRQQMLKSVREVYTVVRTAYNHGMDGVDMMDSDMEGAKPSHRNSTYQKAQVMWMFRVMMIVAAKRVWESRGGRYEQRNKEITREGWKRAVMSAWTRGEPCSVSMAGNSRRQCKRCYKLMARYETKTVRVCETCGPICKHCEVDGMHKRYRSQMR